MIPTTVVRAALTGFGLAQGHLRLLSTRFGKICLAHTARDGTHTQIRLVRAQPDAQARLASEMAWLTHLAARHHLAVPAPRRWQPSEVAGAANGPREFVSADITARDGSAWLAVACRWVPGRHLNLGLRAADMSRAGALLAQMHLANADVPAGIAERRHTWGIPRLFALATSLRQVIDSSAPAPSAMPDALASALRASHTMLQEAWSTLPTGALHEGVIHTDAHWQNLRWTRHRVGIVDFEDCACGRFMLDVACLWSKVEGRRGDERLLQAVLDGYDRVRPLPVTALRDLHVMLAFRRFDYAGWVLSWPRLDREAWGPRFLAGTPAYMDRWLSR